MWQLVLVTHVTDLWSWWKTLEFTVIFGLDIQENIENIHQVRSRKLVPDLSCCVAQKESTNIGQCGFSQTSSSTTATQIEKVCVVISFWIVMLLFVEHYSLGINFNDANGTNFNNNKWSRWYFLRNCLSRRCLCLLFHLLH